MRRGLLLAAAWVLSACPGEFSPAPLRDTGPGSETLIRLDTRPIPVEGTVDSAPISIDTGGDLAIVPPDSGLPADHGLMTSSEFGEACGVGVGVCAPGLTCVNFQGSPGAYCTKICTQIGVACTGTPAGTVAGCLAQIDGGAFVCAFVCRLQGQQYACPGTLTCSATPNPPGSSQYLCL